MKKFMDKDFLLKTKTAKRLFHNYAEKMPIYDYHCHLIPQEIAEDKKYNNITEIWLYGDHYKWRFMRSMGVDEKYCTGDASDYDKFFQYAKCIGYAIGNPLYHWTHLELQRFFGIYEPLNEKTAPKIWEKVNKIIQSDGFSARELITKSNVAYIGTTDDPIDNLEWHKKIREIKDFKTKVIPAFRPDTAVNIEKEGYKEYIEKLSAVYGKEITSYQELKDAMVSRLDYFETLGSKLSDHALQDCPYIEATDEEVDKIFKSVMAGETISREDAIKYRTSFNTFFGREYARRGWVMQLHIGALRNNNLRMFAKLGPDKGFDSIDDNNIAQGLSKFLGNLEKDDQLPKTILYSLNPCDNFVLGTMLGNFQQGGIKGKIQFGSAWWFNDHIDGMTEQMKALGNLGALAAFVGMLTDSRSFLSYPRHEYFRRILCDIIGDFVEEGQFDNNEEILGKIVEDICFNNAKEYFDM